MDNVIGYINTNADKFDNNKTDLTLLDRLALENIAQVMMFGAKKYDRNNWRKGLSQNRLCAAALRHLYAHIDGETFDNESGLLHLAHAGCCIMFAINMLLTKPELDDRIKRDESVNKLSVDATGRIYDTD